MSAMVSISENLMAPFPSGVLNKSKKGKMIGAIGISGWKADNDEYKAMAGVLETN